MSLYDNYSKQQNSMYRGSSLSRRHNAGVDEYGEPWEKVTAPHTSAVEVPKLTTNAAFDVNTNDIYGDNFQPSQSVLDARGDYYNKYPNAELSNFNGNSVDGLFDSFSASGFKDVTSGIAGLYGMYQGNKMLGLAEDDLNTRRQAYTDNKNRRDNFERNTSQAFA